MLNQIFKTKTIKAILAENHALSSHPSALKRVLGPWQLTALGIGAIIGAGIFVLTGIGAHDKAGPALILSFVASGAACIFCGLCYAEMAAMIPVAGSAYTYVYATLGELAAWMMGWNLILAYGIASASVSNGWSHYFQDFLGIFGAHIPHILSTSPFIFSPEKGRLLATGAFLDVPAVLIALALSAILVVGISESATVNAIVVATKVLVVLFVIALGSFYVHPANWHPFAPYGYGGLSLFGKLTLGHKGPGGTPVGMLAGAAIIFFAYIGFDALSTQTEEAKNPQKDVPLSIIASLLICTVLYIAVTAVLTGMVPYRLIDIGAPISNAFKHVGLPWAQFLVSIGAIAGLTSTILVMMLALSRILMVIGRDGLLPPSFSHIHEKYRTPWKSTLAIGAGVASMAGLVPLRVLAEITNIATLLTFAAVCAGVLILRWREPGHERPFRCPWVPVVPLSGIACCLILMFSLSPATWLGFLLWLAFGVVVYFLYGRNHSTLANPRALAHDGPLVNDASQ